MPPPLAVRDGPNRLFPPAVPIPAPLPLPVPPAPPPTISTSSHVAPVGVVYVPLPEASTVRCGLAGLAAVIALVTKAVVAIDVSLSPAVGVGAFGSPVNVGESSGAPPLPPPL